MTKRLGKLLCALVVVCADKPPLGHLSHSTSPDAGIPLNVGGEGGSAADWAQYMQFNPGAQRTAFDSVLNASRAIDTKYGTQITQDVWKNVMQGNFTPYP